MEEPKPDLVGRYYLSGIRPRLLYGGDRAFVLLVFCLSILLVYLWMNVWSLLLAVALWFGGLGALRRAARVDPLLFRVYLRRICYRAYYCARRIVTSAPRWTPRRWIRR